jgi:predicted Fe-Mo cluster-binding NifX family protein
MKRSRSVKIAIPRFEESVAPCFEYSATMAIFTVEGMEIVSQVDVSIRSRVAFDRIRLLREHGVDTVICGGVQEVYEDMLRAHGIHVVSWVAGNVEDLLHDFLLGRLQAGSGRLGSSQEETEQAEQPPAL